MNILTKLPNCQTVSADSRAEVLRELRDSPRSRLIGRIKFRTFVICTFPTIQAAAEHDREAFSDAMHAPRPTLSTRRVMLHLELLDLLDGGAEVMLAEGVLSVTRLASMLRRSGTKFAYPQLACELRSLGWKRFNRMTLDEVKEQVWYRVADVSPDCVENRIKDFAANSI